MCKALLIVSVSSRSMRGLVKTSRLTCVISLPHSVRDTQACVSCTITKLDPPVIASSSLDFAVLLPLRSSARIPTSPCFASTGSLLCRGFESASLLIMHYASTIGTKRSALMASASSVTGQ